MAHTQAGIRRMIPGQPANRMTMTTFTPPRPCLPTFSHHQGLALVTRLNLLLQNGQVEC